MWSSNAYLGEMPNAAFSGSGKDRRKAKRLLARLGILPNEIHSNMKDKFKEGPNWGLILTFWGTFTGWVGLGYALSEHHPKASAGLYTIAIFQLSLAFWLWSKWKKPIRTVPIIAFISICLLLGYRWLINPFQEPKYSHPKGPAMRADVTAPTPSRLLCQGLSEEAETQCLCPRSLPYELTALAPPSDDNYATQMTITAKREPMYRLRIFARTQMRSGKISASPYSEGKAALSVMEMDYDPYSLVMNSSAPQNEFTLEVHSAEGLRLKCINQDN